MTISNECIAIFKKAIDDYHIFDSVDRELKNPFSDNQVFKKNIYKKLIEQKYLDMYLN